MKRILRDPDWIAFGDPYSCEGLTQRPPRADGALVFSFVRLREQAHAAPKRKSPSAFAEGACRDPDWIQTNDPKLRRFVLYSAELPGRYFRLAGVFAIPNPI